MRRSTDRTEQVMTSPRPDNFERLKQTITDHYDGLSRRLQDVAEYAMAHPDEMALETIAVIASRAKVPPSSLIRFSKALGFDGFSEMQRLFRERLMAHAPAHGERIMRLQDHKALDVSPSFSILDEFTTANIDNLQRLRRDFPFERLDEAVEKIAAAPAMHIIGQRRAYPIACYLSYLLNDLDCQTMLLDGVGGMLEQQARALPADGLLIAVSFRPYAPEVIGLIERCRERGISLIGLTDGPLSPLARYADVSLEVVEPDIQNLRPLNAVMCLCLTLAASLRHHQNLSIA